MLKIYIVHLRYTHICMYDVYRGDWMICINKYGMLEMRDNAEDTDMEMIGGII